MPSPTVEQTETMDFFEAYREVMLGRKIRRPGWPEIDCIFLHADVVHIRNDKGLHQYLTSKSDMEATDWDVVSEE